MKSVYLSLIDDSEGKIRFSKLYFAYKQDIFFFVYSILLDEHDAEDAMHEAFILLAKSIESVSSLYSAGTRSYLFKIAKTASLKIYKKRQRAVPTDFSDWEISDSLDIEEEVINKLEHERLKSCLRLLSKEDYRLLYLFAYEEKSILDIANILGISYEAAKKRLQRARERLRELMENSNID